MRSERLGVLRLTAHPSINDTAEAHLFNPLGALRGDVMVDAERRNADKKPGKELEQRPGKTGKSHFQTCRFVTSSIISLASPSLHPPDSCRIAPPRHYHHDRRRRCPICLTFCCALASSKERKASEVKQTVYFPH